MWTSNDGGLVRCVKYPWPFACLSHKTFISCFNTSTCGDGGRYHTMVLVPPMRRAVRGSCPVSVLRRWDAQLLRGYAEGGLWDGGSGAEYTGGGCATRDADWDHVR